MLQTGRMPFQPAKFDLAVILQPGIALIRNMAEGKSITFDVRMPEAVLIACAPNRYKTFSASTVNIRAEAPPANRAADWG